MFIFYEMIFHLYLLEVVSSWEQSTNIVRRQKSRPDYLIGIFDKVFLIVYFVTTIFGNWYSKWLLSVVFNGIRFLYVKVLIYLAVFSVIYNYEEFQGRDGESGRNWGFQSWRHPQCVPAVGSACCKSE